VSLETFASQWQLLRVINCELSLATDLGLAPPIRLSGLLEYPLAKVLSRQFLAQLDIQRYAARSASILGGDSPSLIRRSLIRLLEKDLDTLSERMPHPAPLALQVDLLGAKLRLYAAPLMNKGKSESEESYILSKALMLHGFHVASQLSALIADFSAQRRGQNKEHGEDSNRITVLFPKHYFRVIVMAAMYLLTFLGLQHDISQEDKVLARNSIKHIYDTLMGWSQSERDEFHRSANVISLLSQYVESEESSTLFSETEANPSSSIVENTMRIVWKIRQLKNREATLAAATATFGKSPQLPQVESSKIEMVPDLPDSVDAFLRDDLMPEWNAWLSDTQDVMGLLGSLPNHVSYGDWAEKV
jgi:ferric iron reductase protein FhuF